MAQPAVAYTAEFLEQMDLYIYNMQLHIKNHREGTMSLNALAYSLSCSGSWIAEAATEVHDELKNLK